MITLSRSISDIRLSVMAGSNRSDTVIGDADVIAHAEYTPRDCEDPDGAATLYFRKLIATKQVTLYGEFSEYVIYAGADIKDRIEFDKLREEEEAAQIDYERELEAQEVTC